MADQKKPPVKLNFVKLYNENPELFEMLVDTIRSANTTLMFNRLSVQKEIQWDGRPHVFPPHSVVAVTHDIAQHAVRNSYCVYKEEPTGEYFEDWFLVPHGYDTFCKPMDPKQEDQVLRPSQYINNAAEAEALPAEGKNGQVSQWKRVSYKPQRPRAKARPIVYNDGTNATFLAVGGF